MRQKKYVDDATLVGGRVQSVNGKTGDVVLDATDILDETGVNTIQDDLDSLTNAIPTKTSDLTNDSDFVTSTEVASDYVAKESGKDCRPTILLPPRKISCRG